MRNKIARSKKLLATRSGLIMMKSGVSVSGTMQYKPATSRDLASNLKVSPKSLARELVYTKGEGYYLPLLAVPVSDGADWFTELAILDLSGRLEKPLTMNDFKQYFMQQYRNYGKACLIAKSMYYKHLTARRKVLGTGAMDKAESEISIVRSRIVAGRCLYIL